MVQPGEARWHVARDRREDVKLGRSPGWNPVRAERSRYCIYTFVNKNTVDRVSGRTDLRGNTCHLHAKFAAKVLSLHRSDDLCRSDAEVPLDLQSGETRGYWKQRRPEEWFKPADGEVTTEIPEHDRDRSRPRVSEHRRSGDVVPDLLPGESRGYWKHHSLGKWFRQAKITGKINNEKSILPLGTGAEVSIVDTAFARKVGCYIDTSQSQECGGIGEYVYMTEGRTRIKVTLAGSLVYFFDIWVGDLSGQEAILGMDFMVPAGIRLDLADGSICLPDEVKIQLCGRRQLYNNNVRHVCVDQGMQIAIGDSIELPLRMKVTDREKLWVTRGDRWVPTVVRGPGRIRYLQVTNISDKDLVLHRNERIAMWLARDRIPRIPGYVSIGSRRYMEWQNLAFQATTDDRPTSQEAPTGPPVSAVERPIYPTPRAILLRVAGLGYCVPVVPINRLTRTGPIRTHVDYGDIEGCWSWVLCISCTH
ncbi:hypothetical protein PHYSODRAFT_480856 [Phytophthora sojae]|uniref:Peptidase A2 domain-containing protein n=1 Tax=Phytophthora sojae (strain P6497) TaxID=1094619 RepID=G4YX42_PHYSP|nr:hypothetical protein PHYSODRAFT_480856 [Phytophthora sojae]EGZ25049.1 hypothetical protein PHYSODRAFT_480856 [Phytophthora sojae]|eukprot:XP_009520337.1 hypothetical protein PHYSODRAFT_480856 [Phytophthora sojae]